MPTPGQQSDLSQAILAIGNALKLLKAQVDAAADTPTAIGLTNESNRLNAHLSQLLHAQNAADDAAFASAAQQLQAEVKGLQPDEAIIKSIVKDVQTAGQIVSYIGSALGYIAKL